MKYISHKPALNRSLLWTEFVSQNFRLILAEAKMTVSSGAACTSPQKQLLEQVCRACPLVIRIQAQLNCLISVFIFLNSS